MHMLKIRENNNCKFMATFWVIKKINFALFQLSKNFKSWNIKLGYDKNDLLAIIKTLYTWEILEQN